jgi:hypothetical protein
MSREGTTRDRRGEEGSKAPVMGQPGWLPDHTAERRAEYRRTTPGERVAEAIALSRTATKIAVAAQQRER